MRLLLIQSLLWASQFGFGQNIINQSAGGFQKFTLAPAGCAMDHCTPQFTNAVGIPPPIGALATQCIDPNHTGSGASAGVVSNGSVIVAQYNGPATQPYLVSYDASVYGGGICRQLWTSSIFDAESITSLPMIGSDGGIIKADDTKIVRISPGGAVLWDTCLYSGNAPSCTCSDGVTIPSALVSCPRNNYPTAPTQLADGSIILATNGSAGYGGKIFNIDSSTGMILGFTYLGFSNGDSYVTNNGPCVGVGGQTFFLTTMWSSRASDGRFYAIHVHKGAFSVPEPAPTMHATSWYYPIHGPSGASPLCDNTMGDDGAVFVDGTDAIVGNTANLYGWRQSDGSLLFDCLSAGGSGCPTLPGSVPTTFGLDPAGGGFWVYSTYSNKKLYKRYESDGTDVPGASFSVSAIIPEDTEPTGLSSVLSMSVNPGNSHSLVTVALEHPKGASYISVIDLNTGSLVSDAFGNLTYWMLSPNVNLPPGIAEGQFPVIIDPTYGLPRIALTDTLGGLYIIGVNHP